MLNIYIALTFRYACFTLIPALRSTAHNMVLCAMPCEMLRNSALRKLRYSAVIRVNCDLPTISNPDVSRRNFAWASISATTMLAYVHVHNGTDAVYLAVTAEGVQALQWCTTWEIPLGLQHSKLRDGVPGAMWIRMSSQHDCGQLLLTSTCIASNPTITLSSPRISIRHPAIMVEL